MQANMVFTVEPEFIFLPKGIRLEDDVVIQETGEPFNLMRNIPIEVEEIELNEQIKVIYMLIINSLAQSRLFFFEQ
jgi:hypothetical protein